MGVVDVYAGAALGPWPREGVECRTEQGAPHPTVLLGSLLEVYAVLLTYFCPTKTQVFLQGWFLSGRARTKGVGTVWYLVRTPFAPLIGIRDHGTYRPSVPGIYWFKHGSSGSSTEGRHPAVGLRTLWLAAPKRGSRVAGVTPRSVDQDHQSADLVHPGVASRHVLMGDQRLGLGLVLDSEAGVIGG
jgi:hypothetical protein